MELRVRCSVPFGQRICAVGSVPQLGKWQVLEGLPLDLNGGDIWSARVDFSVSNAEDPCEIAVRAQPIQLKYVVIRQRGVFQDALWECGPNRIIIPKSTPTDSSHDEVDEFRFGDNSWVTLGVPGLEPTTFRGKRDGQRYCVRLLDTTDGDDLGALFCGLSEKTLKRYRPHDMTAAHALVMCQRQKMPSDTLRFVVTGNGRSVSRPKESIVAYMIVDFAIPQHEMDRYATYGITNFTSGVDCSYAPVVADEYQGSGIAFDAMQCILYQLQGTRKMLLLGGVQDSNEQAKAFYRKLGFHEVGGYHSSDGYNVDMMVDRQDKDQTPKGDNSPRLGRV